KLSEQEQAEQPSGLAGAIRREITEQTASELAGLTRAQYDLIKQNLSLSEQRFALEQQHYAAVIAIMQSNAAIERNTALTVTELRAAVTELKTISKNTNSETNKRGYTP